MESSDVRIGEDLPTPADGDDYTYPVLTGPVLTGPELAAVRMDSIEARLRIIEQELRTEMRTVAERLQQVEHVLDQYAGDHR